MVKMQRKSDSAIMGHTGSEPVGGYNGTGIPSGPFPVAVDDGYAQVKSLAFIGGQTRRTITPTSVCASVEGITDLTGEADIRTLGWYETDGRRFTAGERVAGEETRFASFHTSSLNRVAVYHALAVAGFSGHEVSLVAGLPVADYYLTGAGINSDLIGRKIANLKTEVTPLMAGQRPVRVTEVRVLAQAVAAWVDYAVKDNLDLRDDVDVTAPVGVIDIGGRTTDCAVVIQGNKIEHRRSGTENIGVIDLRSHLANLVARTWAGADNLPPASLDRAIRTGSLRLFGRDRDVAEMVNEARHIVSDGIRRAVERHLVSVADLEAVLIVGGGALVFPDMEGFFPNGKIVDDPEFANARGMIKYVRTQQATE